MALPEGEIVRVQHTLQTSTLEISYEKACRQVEMVCESEIARQLRLETMLLEDENEDLHTQLAQGDERIDDLEQYVLGLQDDVGVGAESLNATQEHLRIKNREIETLKAELASLSGITVESTKLLTEKLTLAREVSNLKPELDHLRSQATSYQSLLAEKLSLQRQLNTLQVEVENEKRSTQRLATKKQKPNAEDFNVEARLETAQAELAKERRERQHADREAQKASTALENKLTMYESRLDAFRGKLKSTKDLLKETQGELQKANVTNGRTATAAVPLVPTARTFRKRKASDIDTDTMIGTPGDLPLAKKGKAKSTLPGEKSTFSITPFLNRTAGVRQESLVADDDQIEDEEDNSAAAQSPSKPKQAGMVSQPTARKTMDKIELQNDGDVGDASDKGDRSTTIASGKSLKSVTRAAPRKAMVAPKLAQVVEEAESLRVTKKSAEKKKVKRKILGSGLGKTLFDEEDGDALKGERKVGSSRGFHMLGKGNPSGLKVGAGALGGFGAFSPLKKDRRAGIA